MQLNLDYEDALILKDKGIKALIDALGEAQASQFLALFDYYKIDLDSGDLQIKDYTEWRRTQSFYNDADIDEVFALVAKREKERGKE
jgi:hypothetical protein